MPRTLKTEAPALRLDPEQLKDGADWNATFGSAERVEVEIGIGKGRFLLAVAALQLETRFLGVEWANQYLRIAEERAQRRGLTNVRFIRVDARALLGTIPEDSISAFYIFYPDPWPKKRHHKRRLIQPDTVAHLARSLRCEGLLHASTDHAEYWGSIEAAVGGNPDFERLARFGGDAFPLPTDEPLTNFEAKYRTEGRDRHRASWRRRQRKLEAPLGGPTHSPV